MLGANGNYMMSGQGSSEYGVTLQHKFLLQPIAQFQKCAA